MPKVLITAPVRQDEETFLLYLESLRDLEVPEGFQVDKMFYFHNCEELATHLKGAEFYKVLNDETTYKCDDNTHEWKGENFNKVIGMKNCLLKDGLDYDYVFLVDSDLILRKETLKQLVKADKEMVVNVFWTKWQSDTQPMPNAWNIDHYGIIPNALEKWKEKGLYPIGMGGACTLLKRSVLEKGVNFSPIPNVSFSVWEDRAFCIRAMCAGVQPWLDTHYPAIHLYRESELEKYKKGEIKWNI